MGFPSKLFQCTDHVIPLALYQQQVWKLTKMRQFECPHDAILKDIVKEMKAWQEARDHLIVITDFNDAVTDPDVQAWATNLRRQASLAG